MNDDKVLILPVSFWTWLSVLAGCFVFLGIAVLMVRDGRAMGWVCWGAFGLGAVIATASLCPGVSFLKLEHNGFMIRTLGRERRYSWTDVGTFEVRKIEPLGRYVCFGVVIRGRKTWAMLTDSYRIKPEPLSELMNAWRERSIESWVGRARFS
jgi:hypothetical protein